MHKHDIMPEFFEVVRCFQDKACNLEEAFGGASWKKCTPHRKGTSSPQVEKPFW